MTAPAPIDDSDPDNDSAASDDLVAVPGGGVGAGSPGAEPVRDSEGKRERVPWWRRRRRLFYLAVVVAVIGVPWGGWVWWYRANFPIPYAAMKIDWQYRGLRVSSRLRQYQQDLLDWKIVREARHLRLAGTTWEDEDTKARLTFGSDGRLQVNTVSGDSIFGGNYPGRDFTARAGEILNGAQYEFRPLALPQNSRLDGKDSNLLLPDSPWRGLIYCLYDQKCICIVLSPKDKSSEFRRLQGTFTRLPDPD